MCYEFQQFSCLQPPPEVVVEVEVRHQDVDLDQVFLEVLQEDVELLQVFLEEVQEVLL